jgi:indole-3-glycerol phosphate synthase
MTRSDTPSPTFPNGERPFAGPPRAFLEQIIAAKKESVSSKKGPRHLQEFQSRIRDQEPTRPFRQAITRSGKGPIRLIAEIKKASPSKGILRDRFDPIEIAVTYEGEGAAALSVLTEAQFFLGQLAYLNAVRSAVSLPILQKDFIIDETQIYEARALGADAILLILSILTPQQAIDYFHLASELTLSVLTEVHREDELEIALPWAPIIGINNRNLETFRTDIQTTPRLIKAVPSEAHARKTIVTESGIHSRSDVVLLEETGADAMLVGEAFMVAESIQKKVRELLGASKG